MASMNYFLNKPRTFKAIQMKLEVNYTKLNLPGALSFGEKNRVSIHFISDRLTDLLYM
jgi:hypothetical protein